MSRFTHATLASIRLSALLLGISAPAVASAQETAQPRIAHIIPIDSTWAVEERDSVVLGAFREGNVFMFQLRIENTLVNPIDEIQMSFTSEVAFDDGAVWLFMPPDPGIPGTLTARGDLLFNFRNALAHIGLRPWDGSTAEAWEGATRGVFHAKIRPRGDRVAFPLKVIYADGSIERWTGPSDSDHPAPTIRVVSHRGGIPAPALLMIVGAMALIAVVSLAFRLLRRRGRPAG